MTHLETTTSLTDESARPLSEVEQEVRQVLAWVDVQRMSKPQRAIPLNAIEKFALEAATRHSASPTDNDVERDLFTELTEAANILHKHGDFDLRDAVRDARAALQALPQPSGDDVERVALAERLRNFVSGTEGNLTMMRSVTAPLILEAADALQAIRGTDEGLMDALFAVRNTLMLVGRTCPARAEALEKADALLADYEPFITMQRNVEALPDNRGTDEGLVVAYLRRRAEQEPSAGLRERQGIDQRAVEYGQALLKACADEIESGEALANHQGNVRCDTE